MAQQENKGVKKWLSEDLSSVTITVLSGRKSVDVKWIGKGMQRIVPKVVNTSDDLEELVMFVTSILLGDVR